MDIVIKAIPHAEHRYPTCGDWWYDPDGSLQIRVSKELPQVSQDLVVLHELAEVRMCASSGIGQREVDDYDMRYEKERKPEDASEPGDHIEAPYFKEHQAATAIERLAASVMGVDWKDHEAAIEKLFE